MKDYSSIQGDLQKGEKIEKQIIPNVWDYLHHWIIGGFLCLFYIFPGVIYIIVANLVRKGNKYYITNKRVIHEFTFLSRKVSGTSYDKIQDIHLTQNLIERLFKIGTIHMNTSGSQKVEVSFKGIEHPRAIKNHIDKHLMK